MGSLTGKTALVTGGSRGIGRAIVRRLADDGASVIFSFVKNRSAANEVVAGVRQTGGEAVAVQADQGRRDDLERLFGEAVRHFGELDVLVMNAAAAERIKIGDITEDDYDRMMAVNTKGPFLAIQFAGQKLRDNGRIINISTINTSRSSSPAWGVYNAGKAAVEQLIVAAANEFGARGITANSVSPGVTDTDGLREKQNDQALATFTSLTALRRLGRPSDIANVVSFLAGPESQWITGQNIRATGGLA